MGAATHLRPAERRAGLAPLAPLAAVIALAASVSLAPAPWIGAQTAAAQAAPAQPSATEQTVDVVELTAEQLAQGYAEGRYTVTQVTRAFLARIEQYEGYYNAFISMNPDALADAAALDAELASGSVRGPLHGVPVVVKDNIDVAGLVTTAGWDGFSSATGGVDMVPQDDAAIVERLRAAGVVLLGKTNLPDFAGHGTRTQSSVAGVTLNPYNVDKAPGGSSGGTATAVASSFAVLGLGTETGGSIQNPAAAQALVGVKPTYGLVPLEGVVPLSGSYVDVAGPLAKSVMDAAFALDVLAGPTYEDLATFAGAEHIPEGGYAAGLERGALEGRRFGLVGPGWREQFLPLAPETEAQYREAIAAVEALGAETVEDPFAGSGFRELWDDREGGSTSAYDMYLYFQQLGDDAPFNSIEGWEELAGREYPRGRRNGELVPPVRPSATESGDAYQGWRADFIALFRQVLEDHELDGLLFPQAGSPAPDLVQDPERPDFNPNNWPELPSNIVNDLGVPVVTVPFGWYDDGTPFVLAFIGDRWSEAELLMWAYDLEQATLARRAPTLDEGRPES
ncbi:amidase [Gaopeijia maritima]|uniref:amidase n=1 Tax=Gaopeijia maritima TaxID=3119007 RepID=UPI003245E7D0